MSSLFDSDEEETKQTPVTSTVTATSETTPDTQVDVHNPFQGAEDLQVAAAQIAPRDPFAEALLNMAPAGEAQVPAESDGDPRNVTEVEEDT